MGRVDITKGVNEVYMMTFLWFVSLAVSFLLCGIVCATGIAFTVDRLFR